jgi:hypothetical protein
MSKSDTTGGPRNWTAHRVSDSVGLRAVPNAHGNHIRLILNIQVATSPHHCRLHQSDNLNLYRIEVAQSVRNCHCCDVPTSCGKS